MSNNEIDLFNIPAVWWPGQTDEEWQLEAKDAFDRAAAINQFLDGKLPAFEFLEIIDSQQYDVINLAEGFLYNA